MYKSSTKSTLLNGWTGCFIKAVIYTLELSWTQCSDVDSKSPSFSLNYAQIMHVHDLHVVSDLTPIRLYNSRQFGVIPVIWLNNALTLYIKSEVDAPAGKWWRLILTDPAMTSSSLTHSSGIIALPRWICEQQKERMQPAQISGDFLPLDKKMAPRGPRDSLSPNCPVFGDQLNGGVPVKWEDMPWECHIWYTCIPCIWKI